MDAGDTARRILSLLEGSPADAEHQLLKNATELIQSGPKVASNPSLSVAGDYLPIFRYFLRSAFIPHCGCPIPPWNDGICSRAPCVGVDILTSRRRYVLGFLDSSRLFAQDFVLRP